MSKTELVETIMVIGELALTTDVVVIGGGPGGYVAAIRASQLGKRVILVDAKAEWGGICLHHGCIPSKALIHATDFYNEINSAADFGVSVSQKNLDMKKLQQWKKGIIDKLTNGIKYLCNANKIEIVKAFSRFQDTNRV
ncbi:MAG: FAD-dependent oxidoreductase, partial [Candidatus Diapherotrites archaeon]|nr:FAD-dependent oxidoreductase [Candidatus Diapherotrites archaeon]